MKKLFSLLAVAMLTLAAMVSGCDGSMQGDIIDKMARYVDQTQKIIFVSLDTENAAALMGRVDDSGSNAIKAALPISCLLTKKDITVAHAPNIADLKAFEAIMSELVTDMVPQMNTLDGTDMLTFYIPADTGFALPVYSVINPEPGIFVIGYRVSALKHLNNRPTGLSIEEKVKIRKLAKENNAIFFNQSGSRTLLAIHPDGVDIDMVVTQGDKVDNINDFLSALPRRISEMDPRGAVTAEAITNAVGEDAFKPQALPSYTLTTTLDSDFVANLIPIAIAQLPNGSPATEIFSKYFSKK